MSAGYDGTISIDTRVDAKGMSKGTKSMSNSLGGVLRALKFVGAAMGVAFSGAAIFGFIKNAMSQFDLMQSAIGGNIQAVKTSFTALQGAIAQVGAALLIQLTPFIITAVTWLTTLATTLAQVISALFGVKQGMGAVADATKKTGKEAKGALAAFDQINVLQKNDNNAADTGLPTLPMLAVPPELLAQVDAFKQKMMDFLQPVTDALGRLVDALTPLGETIWAGLKWAWDNILVPLGTWQITELLPHYLDLLAAAATVLNSALVALQPIGIWLWENFLQPLATWSGGVLIQALEWLTARLYDLSAWIDANPEKFLIWASIIGVVAATLFFLTDIIGIVVAVMSIFTGVVEIAGIVLAAIASPVFIVIGVILLLIGAIVALIVWWPVLVAVATKAWEIIKSVWLGAAAWFKDTVIIPLMTAFDKGLDFIQTKFHEVFANIKDFAKNIVNEILDIINGMVNGMLGAIGQVLLALGNLSGSAAPSISGHSTGSLGIPHLATGAVIPPNAQFAAVLGDQRSGTNIETPVALMQQTFEESLAKVMGNQNFTVTIDGSMSDLISILHPAIKKEDTRKGNSLVTLGSSS